MANQLEQVLKRTQAVYKQAAEELAKKLADFQAKFAAKDKEKRALLAAGEITQQEYKSWLAGQVFQGKQWEAKAKEAAETLVHANQEAAAIVNDGCLTAYAAAMNYGTYELEKATALKTGFTLYNRETVSRLIKDNPQLLPYWKIDQPKDYLWNYEKVKNAIIQGIIQGKPIPEITGDLTDKLQTLNTNRMRLFARTGMTGAHNAGRMDALHRAADKGIKVKKKWLAMIDGRQRDAHEDLDGDIKEIDEPFENDLGEIMYPGDPSADPANVYNCRCTLVYIYPELEEAPEGTEPAPEYEQMTFDQWVEAKENQEAVQGETDPETVTAEDAREPEPEIQQAAEELEQTEPEPEMDPVSELTDETKQAIDDYIEGYGNKFTDEQVEEITDAMTTTDKPLYRVEDMSWMAENLEDGDTFTFDKPLKGFTQDWDGVSTVIAEGDDAGLYGDGPVVIYETVGETDHLDISGISRNHEEENESLVGGTFRVVEQHDGPTIAGRETWIMQIEQVPAEAEPAAAETVAGPIMNGDRTVCERGVEYGELFTNEQKEITERTIRDLDTEDPLGRPLGEVVDIRVSRGIDQGTDHLELYEDNPKLVPCNAQYLSPGHNAPVDSEPKIEVHNEGLSTQPLASEFDERHALREKYGDGNMEGSTAFDYAASSLEGTIRHEYAHALMDSYGFFGNGDEPLQKEAREWVLDFWKNHQHELMQISKYAASHPDEMIAECYVQVADKKHQGTIAYKTANTVITQMRGYIERAKGR